MGRCRHQHGAGADGRAGLPGDLRPSTAPGVVRGIVSIDRSRGRGGPRSDEASASMYEARERIMEALTVLGGSMGAVVWDVIGFELPQREHVARQAGVKRVTVHEARDRVIAGLDILARAWL